MPASALADLLGVSLVEVYSALNRLRGRTASTASRPDGGGRPHPDGRAQIAPADRTGKPSSNAHDEPQLW